MSETYYAVYATGGLRLSYGYEPLGFFQDRYQAENFCESWPGQKEIKPISKDKLIELLQND